MHIQGVPTSILRFVDDSFPGFVEFELVDAVGERHRFIEKVPVLTRWDIGHEAAFPIAEILACEVLSARVAEDGRLLSRIDTSHPWGVESTGGASVFEVLSEVLVDVAQPCPDQGPVQQTDIMP